MRNILVAVVFAGGCYYTPADPPDTVPSTTVDYGTTVLGKQIAFKVDACMQTSAADALIAAQGIYNQYGVDLEYDDNATLYMRCADTDSSVGGDIVARSYPKVGTDYSASFMSLGDTALKAHTIAHEVGHMLGAVHVGSPNSIMYKTMSETDHLTDDDIQMIEFHDQGEVQDVE